MFFEVFVVILPLLLLQSNFASGQRICLKMWKRENLITERRLTSLLPIVHIK